ncbi:MAG: HepT-like ribonuclease domain-containing protein [Fimbriimonadaceae bacterium]
MRRETLACLTDILRAANRVREAVKDVELQAYLLNWEKQSAVERQFMIIGEALVRIRDFEPGVLARIPDAEKIVRLRNLLAHGYDAVDASSLYGYADEPVSGLIEAVAELLP